MDEFPDDDLPPFPTEPPRLASFLGTNIGAFNPDSLLRQSMDQLRTDEGIKQVVYVKDNEFRLFREFILPLARKIAEQKRVVCCDLESDFVPGEHDFPLVIIDAGRISHATLLRLCRLESPQGLCDYLANPKNIALIHLCNIGATKEDLRPLMPPFLDGHFSGMRMMKQPKNTHIVITGVYGQPGIMKCISPNVMVRVSCFGVDWSDETAV